MSRWRTSLALCVLWFVRLNIVSFILILLHHHLDLHGDARVHLPAPSPDHPSGYGFELTFRLKRELDQSQPPTWPAALLNSISKYVFESENKLVPGDHINWGKSLDGSLPNLRHLLVSEVGHTKE